MKYRNLPAAFTLMELVIVIAIIAILTTALLPFILQGPKRARDSVKVKRVYEISTAIDAYIAMHNKVPTDDATHCLTSAIMVQLGLQFPEDCAAYFYRKVSMTTNYSVLAKVELYSHGNCSACDPAADIDTEFDTKLTPDNKPGQYYVVTGR